MKPVVVLLLALLCAPVAAPIASAFAAPADAHDCCPGAPAEQASTAPCQYVVALGCCDQAGVPAATSSDAPSARSLAFAAVPAASCPAPSPALRAAAPRADHGPPNAPLLRVVVLQL